MLGSPISRVRWQLGTFMTKFLYKALTTAMYYVIFTIQNCAKGLIIIKCKLIVSTL